MNEVGDVCETGEVGHWKTGTKYLVNMGNYYLVLAYYCLVEMWSPEWSIFSRKLRINTFREK